MPADAGYNFRNFTDTLDTSGVVGKENTAGLAAEGYVAMVNLLPEDSEYALDGEQSIVESQGLGYFYRPVDFDAPTADDYHWFEKTVSELPAGKTLIHCAANYRVSAFSAAYAYRNLGWSVEDCRRFVADVWDISEYPVWAAFLDGWLAE